jgi:2-polyprenyl-3-methyl-5-hydroxy-6-metoxy-1,4-benzoquinol methylase
MPDVVRYSTLDDPVIVPIQRFAYEWITRELVQKGESVLDVGPGLGYGMDTLATKAAFVQGLEVDPRAVLYNQAKGRKVWFIDGRHIPRGLLDFEVITCIDVLEHVDNPRLLIEEMVTLARRTIIITTPNRRPENTLPDGTPRNRWHLQEWTPKELAPLLCDYVVDWYFIEGANYAGPYRVVRAAYNPVQCQALMPIIRKQA